MARETYAQAVRNNDGRPTCVSCYSPTRYDRFFRASRLCFQCWRDEPVYIIKKETTHG
jgi:hypothetical protein